MTLWTQASIVGAVPPALMTPSPRAWTQPAITGASTANDDVVAEQTRVADQSTRIAVVVEGCKAKITPPVSAQWDALAQKALAYSSADPGSTTVDAGATILGTMNAFSLQLQSMGCSNTPPPVPVPAPSPSPGGGPPDWANTVKWVAVAVVVVAGVYFLAPIAMTAIAFVPKPKHAEARITRVPITRIVIHEGTKKHPWRADVFDASGSIRSRVTGYSTTHGHHEWPHGHTEREYVEKRVADEWPGVPVEYVGGGSRA